MRSYALCFECNCWFQPSICPSLAGLKLWQFTKLNHKNQITMYTKIAFQSFHLNKCYAHEIAGKCQSKFLTHQPNFLGESTSNSSSYKIAGFRPISPPMVARRSPLMSKQRLGGAIPSINSSKAWRGKKFTTTVALRVDVKSIPGCRFCDLWCELLI